MHTSSARERGSAARSARTSRIRRCAPIRVRAAIPTALRPRGTLQRRRKKVPSSGAFFLGDASNLDQPNEQDRDRDDEKNMNEAGQRVTGHEPEQPEDQKDYEDGPKHRISPSLWAITTSR